MNDAMSRLIRENKKGKKKKGAMSLATYTSNEKEKLLQKLSGWSRRR